MQSTDFSGLRPRVAAALASILALVLLEHSPARPQLAVTPARSHATLSADLNAKVDSQQSGEIRPVPAFLDKGLAWLADAQFPNGGWGAGTHANQGVLDPRAVQIDPATTAFSAMALIRSGNTLKEGPYHRNVQQALEYMLNAVEEYPEEGTTITNLTGTQPQAKLGQNIDVTMCAQFFARVLPHTKLDRALHNRVTLALDKCLRKIEKGQNADGSWTDSGWAPVLQSSMANSALELGEVAGRKVSQEALKKSRDYQKSNVDARTGKVRTEKAAGVSLYSLTGNQRATAPEARQSRQMIDDAKQKGILEKDAEVSVDNLIKAGADRRKAQTLADAYRQNEAGKAQLRDETVLSGFGNNGGEEFLSYMMSSEAMVVTGGKDWGEWHEKISRRLENSQNSDGSWSGQHCITSPVFCTAAVILTLTAERDEYVLRSEQARHQPLK